MTGAVPAFTVLGCDPGTAFTISDVVAYVDTVACLARYPIPHDFWEKLGATRPGRIIPAHPKLLRHLYQPLRIQQPTADTLRFLEGLREIMMCRVDIAVDFICPEPARSAASYFDRLLMQKWHGKRRKNRYKNSIYWSKHGPTARNLVLYADRPSKTGLGPCIHVELRFSSAKACRLVGLSNPSSLLQKVDAMALLKRQTRLARVDTRRFARLTEKIAREHLRQLAAKNGCDSAVPIDAFSTVDGLRRQISESFCLRFHTEEGVPEPNMIKVQELVERLPMMRPCLTSIAWEMVIPEPRWVLPP